MEAQGVEWITIWVVIAICAAVVAGNKNRSAGGWFFITLLIPIAILILLCLNKLPEQDVAPPQRMARCPYCAELIQPKAIVCKHCGREVIPLESEAGEKPEAVETQPEPIPQTPEVPSKICPHCGANNDLSWQKCGRCFMPLSKESAGEKMAEQP